MTYLLAIRRLHFEINKWVVLDENTGLIRLIPVYQILYCRLDVGWNSNIFDRESISHGPTSLKIVVLLGTLLKMTFKVTVTFNITWLLTSQRLLMSQYVPKSLNLSQKSQNVPKSLKKSHTSKTVPKVSKSFKRLKKSQNECNLTVKHWKPFQSRFERFLPFMVSYIRIFAKIIWRLWMTASCIYCWYFKAYMKWTSYQGRQDKMVCKEP